MIMNETTPAEFPTPVRNRYFYGKLLDVFHFELETDYMNAKRWLLNRLVTGWGVVCGLDVQLIEDGSAIVVTPGMALDPWGQEILVSTPSRPVLLPDEPWGDNDAGYARDPARPQRERYDAADVRGEKEQHPDEEERYYHVVLCYHECQSGPTPVLAGDCGEEIECAAGTIEERYRVEIRPDRLDPISVWDCQIPDAITRGELQYEVLVRWVTDNCPELPDDPCIPLANIRVHRGHDHQYCEPSDIDISIRQLALSNRALFYLLMSMLFEAMPRRRR
jgi:hypothetical protein